MDFNMYNSIELNQNLKITPQIQQSIKILQMSCQELIKYIEQQSLENPMIEIDPHYEELDYREKLKKKLDWLNECDEENRVYYQSPADRNDYDYPIVSKEEDTLTYHLLYQLDLLSLHDTDHKIVKFLIESLNESGYLETSIRDVACTLQIDEKKAEQMLSIVQSFEPMGVGARSLKECLLIQLTHKGIQNQHLYTLIHHHLEELGKNKLNVIAKKLSITIEEVKNLYAIIKTLNPRPGNTFNTVQQTRYVTPDVVVVKFKDYYEVLLNDFSYPKININSFYKNTLSTNPDPNTQNYIAKKMEQACWIMKCIEQRNNTLRNVAKAIVDTQKQFFDLGPGHLVPMILKDLAETIGVHESTVSRAVNDKYLQCSWGIFELKYFFSSGLSTSTAADTTAENIKLTIREMIQKENKKKPYSDQKITNLLKESGLHISRRTVAKYRDEIGIPNASGRKEF